MTDSIKAEDLVSITLVQLCEEMATHLNAEVMLVQSPIYMGLDDAIRTTIESLINEKRRVGRRVAPRRRNLAVVLQTGGGYIEVVERISQVFRKHYREVYFIIPNYAYSAGTVLALSGNRIYMDYYSALGPIDPQIQDDNGKFVPGMGYLFKYNELVEKSNNNTITQAEMLYFTRRFDPGVMFTIEQAKRHSEDLIRDWLPRYKFKDWKQTKTRGLTVTPKMKKDRATKIAEVLGDAEKWHSHGRGITIRELRGRNIKLQIDDFGTDKRLNNHIRHYFGLFTDYTQKTGVNNALHTRLGLRPLG